VVSGVTYLEDGATKLELDEVEAGAASEDEAGAEGAAGGLTDGWRW